MDEKFWMIWRENYDVPTKKHLTRTEAYLEAERLARKHPGSKFYLFQLQDNDFQLEMINICIVPDVHWLCGPEVPF